MWSLHMVLKSIKGWYLLCHYFSARTFITIQATEHHCRLACTKLCCLLQEAPVWIICLELLPDSEMVWNWTRSLVTLTITLSTQPMLYIALSWQNRNYMLQDIWDCHGLIDVYIQVMNRLLKACRGYERWKSQHWPDNKPWLAPEQNSLPQFNPADIRPISETTDVALIDERSAQQEESEASGDELGTV